MMRFSDIIIFNLFLAFLVSCSSNPSNSSSSSSSAGIKGTVQVLGVSAQAGSFSLKSIINDRQNNSLQFKDIPNMPGITNNPDYVCDLPPIMYTPR